MSDVQKLTIKDLNCGNCPKYATTPHPIYPNDIHYCEGNRISEHQKQCNDYKGCASHPLALQVLSASIIEKLEQKKLSSHRMMNNDIEWGRDGNFYCGRGRGVEIAIKLLKGSV